MFNLIKRRWLLRSAVALATIGIVSVAIAEDVWVQRPTVQVRAGKGSLYDVVFEVPQGTKLNVLEHDGNWLHVQYQDKDGWVAAASMSSRQVDSDAFAGLHDSQSSGASSAAAAKGFTPEEFASAKGMSEIPLQMLEADVKKDITPAGLNKFMSDGKVGQSK